MRVKESACEVDSIGNLPARASQPNTIHFDKHTDSFGS